eukprot:1456244-Pleurochrysis_carterae.AAC.1
MRARASVGERFGARAGRAVQAPALARPVAATHAHAHAHSHARAQARAHRRGRGRALARLRV